ncbi:MAG: hypothetical protein ABI599_12285 [Flavobacteriales bacterium]
MLSKPTLQRTLLLMMALAHGGILANAQTFTINGRLKVDGGSVDGSKVVVYKDGVKERTVSSGLGRFALDLEINSNYVLSFEKEGFVSKKLAFDTHAPAEAAENGFTPFEYAVSLFKQYDDVNVVVFNQPVGMIRYEPDADDFDYDTDYTKSIQSQLELIQQQVVEKQAQEAAKNEAEAKSAGEAEKNKAKTEAEATKKAAAAAKEKERLDREQAEAVKKAEAEKAKADALAAKTAAEREKADAAAAAQKLKDDAAAAQKAEAERKRTDAAAAAQAELDRKKAEAVAQEAERNKKPAVAAKVQEEKPRKVAAAPPPKHNELAAGLNEGADARRSVEVTEMSEEPRIASAVVNNGEEAPVVVEIADAKLNRKEELIVEPNQVITVIQLWTDAQKAEYKKIVHKYGAIFYFKNGQACSKELFQQEALASN